MRPSSLRLVVDGFKADWLCRFKRGGEKDD